MLTLVLQVAVSALTLYGGQLEIVSLIKTDGGVGEGLKLQIPKARANPRHFWCNYNVRLSFRRGTYSATVRSDFYGFDTWHLRFEDARRLSIFEH